MIWRGKVPAPIACATIAGAYPLFRALFSGGDLLLAAAVGLVGAVLVYFVVRYLIGKMGLPESASLSEVSAYRKNKSATKP